MASVQYIEKRISGKAAEIEKLEKKLSRVELAASSGWKNNPYYYDESDLKYTKRDLEVARAALVKLNDDLKSANEKAGSRNVPAIIEFLEIWKCRCFEFYEKGLREAFDEYTEVRRLGAALSDFRYGSSGYEEAHKAYSEKQKAHNQKLRGYYEMRSAERNGRTYKTEVKVRDGELEYIVHYMEHSYEESIEKLRRELQEEANRKYDFIIERTNAIVGRITDASALRVGEKGDLNGLIAGTSGTASVQTFGAGGYNIQCFHFSTTIKPVG